MPGGACGSWDRPGPARRRWPCWCPRRRPLPAARSHSALLDRLTAVDLLHIDDVGAERSTDWVLEELYSIVNARYEDRRSMVITTNILDRDALCDQISSRTVSRLTEMCDELPLFGHDHRMDLRSA